jgi:hypothetical protein
VMRGDEGDIPDMSTLRTPSRRRSPSPRRSHFHSTTADTELYQGYQGRVDFPQTLRSYPDQRQPVTRSSD